MDENHTRLHMVLAAALLLMLVSMGWKLWGTNGVFAHTQQLQGQIAQYQQANAKAQQRNAELAAEVADLEAHGALMEEAARTQLGMIKQGEIFVQIAPNP